MDMSAGSQCTAKSIDSKSDNCICEYHDCYLVPGLTVTVIPHHVARCRSCEIVHLISCLRHYTIPHRLNIKNTMIMFHSSLRLRDVMDDMEKYVAIPFYLGTDLYKI